MGKNLKNSGKFAVGFFVDGFHLQMVSLARHETGVRLVEARTLKLSSRLESVTIEEEILSEALSNMSSEPMTIDITAETPKSDLPFQPTESGAEPEDNGAVIYRVMENIPVRKYKVAISVAEPQIYYSYFGTNWGLQGEKLKQRIVEELAKEKPTAQTLKTDAVHLVNLVDGRIMAVVRDADVGVLNLLENIQDRYHKRLPDIAFVESAESSLINLVRMSYDFHENEITVIVYIGHEFSRLIFLRGNNIYNISYIIGAGLDSENIPNIIYSRLLLEQDNLNLAKVDNILLTGHIEENNMQGFLLERLSSDIKIKVINCPDLEISGDDMVIHDFAVPIGAALRVLNETDQDLLNVDLTPLKIKEEQKVFKLGVLGWVLLILIPILTFLITVKIGQYSREVVRYETQLQNEKSELAHLQSLQLIADSMKTQLSYYKNSFAVLDSIDTKTKNWSGFLQSIASNAQKTGAVWMTEITSSGVNEAVLKGYSLYRNRIPRFSDNLNNTTLRKVEVQEIRGQTVYNFEIHADVPDLKPFIWKPQPPPVTNTEALPSHPQNAIREEKNIESTGKVEVAKSAFAAKSGDASVKVTTPEEFFREYENALQLFRKYKYQQAISILQALYRSDIKTGLKINCLYWMGESYFGLKDYNRAIDAFSDVVQVQSSKRKDALFMLGRCFAIQGKNQRARDYMMSVISEYPHTYLAEKAREYNEKLF